MGKAFRIIVVMGVAGSGKSTIARAIADETGWDFAEADDFHSAANIAKMSAGTPLTDDDRWPWLEAIGDWLHRHEEEQRSAVATCSALRREYRDVLRERCPQVCFCELDVDHDSLEQRLEHRHDHYMPTSLLDSQLTTWEALEPDEPGVSVEVDGPTSQNVARVLTALQIRS